MECETFEYAGVRCPYCLHTDRDAWEWHLPDGEWKRVECENCGRDFEAKKDETVTYSGRRLQDQGATEKVDLRQPAEEAPNEGKRDS
jgi:hypothetical protein